jgi:HAD superfamily hydrolase (TIGR01509 family)
MDKLGGVIWDMDGVLVDTGEFHYQSWRDTLIEYQVILTKERFYETFGMNNRSILQLLLVDRFTEQLGEEISDTKETEFRRIIQGKVQLLPGALDLLQAVFQAGIPQAIASSGPPPNIDAIVDALNIRRFFAALVSAADLPGKPDPVVFLTASQSIDVAPRSCVVIEDGLSGVAGAKNAGMKCLAVTTTNPAAKLSQADLIVDRLDQVYVSDLKDLFSI